MKVVTILSLLVVRLEIFFFKVVLCCNTFSAVLLLKEKEKLSQPFLFPPRVTFFFSQQNFSYILQKLVLFTTIKKF